MRFVVQLLLVLAALLAGSRASIAGHMDAIEYLFKCTKGHVCVIAKNFGGIVSQFEQAADEALENGIQIRIEGQCASACVVFASRAHKNVCLTSDARMMIHRGTVHQMYEPLFGKRVDVRTRSGMETFLHPPLGYRTEDIFFNTDYGFDITSWALSQGKLPYEGTYTMTSQEAARYWKQCH